MTTIIKKYKWPALLAVALIVFAALIFFLIKSYTYDSSTYFESRDFIRQLKQADANWNVKILRKKIGVNNNLSLAPPLEANSRWEQLEQLNNAGPLAALWASRRNGYVDAVKNTNSTGRSIPATQRQSTHRPGCVADGRGRYSNVASRDEHRKLYGTPGNSLQCS